MNNKLKIKDLVNIGIFGLIYLVLTFITAMLGLVPILIYAIPIVLSIVAGAVVMLFMAKVPKPWALFLFGMITPLIMFAGGHTFLVPLIAVVFVGIAQLIAKKGKFKSLKYNTISYAVFSCWMTGSLMQMILLKDQYIAAQVAGGMSVESINKIVALISWPSVLIVVLATFASSFLGAFIGKKMLKKHFEKAGIF